jgi:hypothetical protein
VLVSRRPTFLPATSGKTSGAVTHIRDVEALETDWAGVTGWRLHRLLDAGFPLALGTRLVALPGMDLHALLDLVDRGCPPELAVRILGLEDAV